VLADIHFNENYLYMQKSCFFRHHVDCLRAWLLNVWATEKRNSVYDHHRVTKKAATAFFDGKKTLAGSLKNILPARNERDSFFCDFMLASAERKRSAAIHFSVAPVR